LSCLFMGFHVSVYVCVYTGADIFPKLPVYLRTHHTTWLRNQRVQDAVAKTANGEDKLKRLNVATNPTSTTHSVVGPSTLANRSTSRRTVALSPTMPQAPPNMSVPTSPTVVAGIVVGGVSSTVHGTKRRHGERDKDRSKRAKRKCRRCVGNSRSDKEAQECKGAWVRGCDLGYSCVTCGVLWSCDCFQKIQT
jgi:hypothetical protein